MAGGAAERARREVSAAVARARVVNLVGPLGVGKSAVLAAVAADRGAPVDTAGALTAAAGGLVVLDDADSDGAVRSVVALLRASPPGVRFVVASRVPVAARTGWPEDLAVATVALEPWTSAETDRWARGRGVTDPAGVALAVRLSGGIPLIADRMVRALLAGGSARMAAAVGHGAAVETLGRLRREEVGAGDEAILALAVLGVADEDLLRAATPAAATAFEALARCSVVQAQPHGLGVVEPYRTLLDLHHQWRRPLAHHAVLSKGARHRQRQIRITRDAGTRARLAEHALFLSDDPELRRALFPVADPPATRIRPARPGDEDAVARLTREWARRGGFDARACDRLLDSWLRTRLSSFQLAVDGDGAVIGMTNLLPVEPLALPALEPVLQQHLDDLTRHDQVGLVVGMAYAAPRDVRTHAMILRHILRSSIATGRLVVSTPWVPYQRLAGRLGFRHVGATRDGVYRRGDPNEIFTGTFAGEHLPTWLRGLSTGDGGPDPVEPLVRQALRAMRDPVRLGRSPLLASPGIASAADLAAVLRHGMEALATAPSKADAEAGRALVETYLRAEPQAAVAQRLHLSRATYYRRLNHGIARLAQLITVLGMREPPTI